MHRALKAQLLIMCRQTGEGGHRDRGSCVGSGRHRQG